MPMPMPPSSSAATPEAPSRGFGVSLKGRALRLLSAREHSRAELVSKLAPHETTPGELERALDELQAKGFINEQRVLESVLFRKAGKLGAARVKQALQAKGLDPEAIAEAVTELQGSEELRARDVWQKKFGVVPTNEIERARQMRFLLARGFAPSSIRRVIVSSSDE
jgi:regulatory protein